MRPSIDIAFPFESYAHWMLNLIQVVAGLTNTELKITVGSELYDRKRLISLIEIAGKQRRKPK